MEMTEEQLKVIQEGVKKSIDTLLEETLKQVVGVQVAEATKKIVQELRMERALYGYDRSGVSSDAKKELAKIAKAVAFGATKANEEMISEVDSRGGYLLPTEVAKGIERIARSVGLVMSKVKTWPMGSDELEIPAYTGAALEGDYLGVNAAGSLTAVTFKMAKLAIKKWQLAFALGNDLIQDAPEDLADWLMALAAEALANKIDKMVLVGTVPFVGVMASADVTAVTLAAGKNTFQEYAVIDDSSEVIGNLEESLLDEACFIFSRTVWANLRIQKDDSGNYLLGLGGNGPVNTWLLQNDPKSVSGPRPVGEILGFPVFTNRNMPALSASAASTKFGIFGNLRCAAYGSRDAMRLEKYQSGSFGGKEIALADQTGLVFKQRHACTLTLPEGFLTIETNAA
jgi:HK97 family phage major capsid protein